MTFVWATASSFAVPSQHTMTFFIRSSVRCSGGGGPRVGPSAACLRTGTAPARALALSAKAWETAGVSRSLGTRRSGVSRQEVFESLGQWLVVGDVEDTAAPVVAGRTPITG